MAENILTISEYFKKGAFVIPNYQRGYKWGVPDIKGNCAVSVLMDNLLEAFRNSVSEYSIQGVTVYEEEESGNVVLVDGQQRTTTLFLLLKYLGFDALPLINYTIREASDYVLNSSIIENNELIFKPKEDVDYELQDVFYFKEAIRTMHKKLSIKSEDELKIFRDEFILRKVNLFYIIIDKDKATRVFSMMNGQKAMIKTDELIKAALLSKSSRSISDKKTLNSSGNDLNELLQVIKNKVGEEWEINSLRSKYAREWDKWLYWWNREDVKKYFNSGNNPMGLLLEYYFHLNKLEYSNDPKLVSTIYKQFATKFFNDAKDAKDAKDLFKQIRDLQKTFEDWFNNVKIYNYLGLILKAGGDKKEAIVYFLKNGEKEISFEEYAKWGLVGCSHNQITNPGKADETQETPVEKSKKVLANLSLKTVYGSFNEDALRQLLRRNVVMDVKLNRRFDFGIYNIRSLEHIHPKSKVYRKENGKFIRCDNNEECKPDRTFILHTKFREGTSEHCIGNLVLLSGPDNSAFQAKSFDEKKDIFFKPDPKLMKDSMRLLHSLTIFSNSKWDVESISKNKEDFINEFETYYNLKK